MKISFLVSSFAADFDLKTGPGAIRHSARWCAKGTQMNDLLKPMPWSENINGKQHVW